MKKITNQRYRETYVDETLENGLRVILWQKPNYQKSLFMMATPLGAVDLKQIDEEGNTYTFPCGIAHFLEHKMFAMGDQDVMEAFSNMGANVNAFTSYHETAYYTSTSGDPLPPLSLLLDFVQELDVTEASVEKEKGIIIQELHMYKEMSDQRLIMETYSSLFHEHPLKYDIGGDDESVRSIDVDILKECYRLNYHPSKMMLIGVSGHDPEMLLDSIRENQAKKQFPKVQHVTRMDIKEPSNVMREDYTFAMDVSKPKLAVAYKLAGIADPYERTRKEWALRLLLDANFSSINPAYQTWIDDEIINDFCGSDADFGEDYGTIMFYGETLRSDAFITLCEQCIHHMQEARITQDILEQLKRRYFAQSIRSLNSFDDIAITFIRCCFEHIDFFDSLDILYDITMEDIKIAAKDITNAHRAIVRLVPQKER